MPFGSLNVIEPGADPLPGLPLTVTDHAVPLGNPVSVNVTECVATTDGLNATA